MLTGLVRHTLFSAGVLSVVQHGGRSFLLQNYYVSFFFFNYTSELMNSGSYACSRAKNCSLSRIVSLIWNPSVFPVVTWVTLSIWNFIFVDPCLVGPYFLDPEDVRSCLPVLLIGPVCPDVTRYAALATFFSDSGSYVCSGVKNLVFVMYCLFYLKPYS